MKRNLLFGLLAGLLLTPLLAVEPHPDRQLYRTVQKSSAEPGHDASQPIRLKSEVFLPGGELATNWHYIKSRAPEAAQFRVLVRFDSTPDRDRQRQLETAGIRVSGYLPEHAYFARVARDRSAEDFAKLGIVWVGAIYPEDKLPARIRSSGIGAWALRENDTADLRVTLHEGVSRAEVLRLTGGLGAKEIGWNAELRQWTVNLPVKNLPLLMVLDPVRWIEEIPPPPTPMNDGMRLNSQADIAQSPPYGLSGAGVTVGEFDVGYIDPKHADLTGRVILGETGSLVNFHSTHVAGILAGGGTLSAAKGGTNRQWRGVAPATKLISYVFTDSVAKHKEAINKYGISISQNSWGHIVGAFFGNCDLYGDYSMDAPGFDQIVTGLYGPRINVVFAAGNARNNFDTNGCGAGPYRTIGPPGTGKNIITVGAINSNDSSMTSFSSWGPTDDGRLKPELVAPGSEVGGDGGITSTSPGNTYRVLRGTSMAAPVVSGALALLTEDYHARFNGEDPLPSTLRGLLVHTAQDLDDDTSWFNPGPDFASGYGRLQIADALDQLRSNGFLVGQVGPGQTNTYTLRVPPGLIDAKVTLVWDDPASVENSAHALVNDLDLIVWDPHGARSFPWTLDPQNPSADAVRTKEDHLNNLEQVQVDVFGNTGNWTVQVVGHDVPVNASQRYSLIFSPPTIPAPPNLLIARSDFSDNFSGGGNANAVIDPGEVIAETLTLKNADGLTASNVTARLVTDTPGVTVFLANSMYPDLAPGHFGSNSTAYLYQVSREVACGAVIEFGHLATANGVTYSNHFTRMVGQIRSTGNTTNSYEAADASVAIPDDGVLISTNDISPSGTISDLAVVLRLDHQFLGDLQIDLVHPDGTRVSLVQANTLNGEDFGRGPCASSGAKVRFTDSADNSIQDGVAPFAGNFRPEGSLNSLVGKPLGGLWQLVISDTSVEDTGQLICWRLEAVAEQFARVCSQFVQPPLAFGQSLTAASDTGTLIQLIGSAADPNFTYQIVKPPSHGQLDQFDALAGTLRYTPAIDYHGPDDFTFQANVPGVSSAAATVQIQVEKPAADLSINQSGAPLALTPGQELTYTMHVHNAGPNLATGVFVTDALPSGAIFVSAAAANVAFSFDQGVLTGELPDLPAGAGIDLVVVVKPTQIGVLTNLVSVASKQVDPRPKDNSSLIATPINIDTDLALGKITAGEIAAVGAEFAYAITVTNLGPNAAKNVIIQETMPRNVTFLSATSAHGVCSFFNGGLTCVLGELASGSVETISVVISPTVPGKLQTGATVRSDLVDSNSGNDFAVLTVQVRSGADLSLTQSATPNPAALNHDLTYQLIVLNGGPNDATSVMLTDHLPAGVVLKSLVSSQGACTNVDGVLSCDLGDLAKGQKVIVTFVVPAPQLGGLTNVAVVNGNELDLAATNNASTLVTPVNLDADLSILMSAQPDAAVVGQPLTYSLTVENHGPNLASGVTITDVLPPGVGVVAITATQGGATTDRGAVVFTLGDLVVGGKASASLVITPPAVGSLTNRVAVTAQETDLNPQDNNATVITRINQIADLSISMVASPDPAIYGNSLTYTIMVTNQGPQTASGVKVVAGLPAKANFLSANLSQGTFTTKGSAVSCELGLLESFASATVAININPLAVGLIAGAASVSAKELDPDLQNNLVRTVSRVTPFSDLSITVKSLPELVGANHELTYLVTVQNAGPNPAAEVVIIDHLTADMIFVSGLTTEGNCTINNGVVTCNAGELPVGGIATAAIVVKPTRVGQLTNEVSVDAQVIDLFSFNNNSSVVNTVLPDADIAVTVSGTPEILSIGDLFTFAVVVTNQGVLPAVRVVLTNELPANAELQSVQVSRGTYATSDGVVLWEIGDLAPAESATVLFQLRANAMGSVTNTARAGTSDFELDTGNNTNFGVVDVLPLADLVLNVSVDPDPVPLGKPFTYTLNVTNLGPAAAGGVLLTGGIPAGTRVSSTRISQGSCLVQDGELVCKLGTVESGASVIASVVMEPLNAGSMSNDFVVSGRFVDPVMTNNSVSITNLVTPALELFVTQTADPDPVLLGSDVIYQIAISNRTDRLVPAVTLIDTLPLAARFVFADSSMGAVTHDDGTVIFQLGDLDREAGARLTIRSSPSMAGFFTNRITVISRAADATQTSLFSNLRHAVVETPTLNFDRVGSRLVLTWPSVATGFALEAANSLSPKETWSLERSPRVTSGAFVTTTVKLSGTARFYRLRKQ